MIFFLLYSNKKSSKKNTITYKTILIQALKRGIYNATLLGRTADFLFVANMGNMYTPTQNY